MYDTLDYDVFVLSQRDDGYSPSNEQLIRDMFGSHHVVFKYVEDYPIEIHQREADLCKYYHECVKVAKKRIQKELVTNDFVTCLWYRRWLNNQMRVEYELEHNIKYDWVIRTRFDISYRAIANRVSLSYLSAPPKPDTIYMFPDTFSCGVPDVINYESDMINHWPYIYNKYLETGSFSDMANNHSTIKKWLFMSEMNLIQYFKGSCYKTQMLHHVLKITRRNMIQEISSQDIRNDHIIGAHYGCGETWVDVTDTFIELFVNQFDNRENGSLVRVSNSLSNSDPVPRSVKSLVVNTLEGNEYVYRENTTPLIKYQYFYSIDCPLKNIKKVTYGVGKNQPDVTKRFITMMKKSRHILFICNKLTDDDPSPGDEKSLTIITTDGAHYEFIEYSILELT